MEDCAIEIFVRDDDKIPEFEHEDDEEGEMVSDNDFDTRKSSSDK